MTHTQHEPRPSMLTHFFGGIGKRLNVRWKVETLPIHEPNLNQKRADQPHSEHGAFNALKMGAVAPGHSCEYAPRARIKLQDLSLDAMERVLNFFKEDF